jgi:hypothetical protein
VSTPSCFTNPPFLIIRDLHSGILRFGAIATVISLAVDPFAQQLVNYRQKLIFSNDTNTTIARAQRYSQGNQIMMTMMADPCKQSTAPSHSPAR